MDLTMDHLIITDHHQECMGLITIMDHIIIITMDAQSSKLITINFILLLYLQIKEN